MFPCYCHVFAETLHKEETIERMRLDEEVLMDFFREYISVSVSLHFKFNYAPIQINKQFASLLKRGGTFCGIYTRQVFLLGMY